MSQRNSYIVDARRSPVGHMLGGLAKLTATAIGAQVAKALITDNKVDAKAIDEAYIGQVLQAGAGQNPARQVALGAGLPDTISCTTVNKVCGSSLQAAMFADLTIRAGEADLVLTGGIESMTQAPFISRTMRAGNKFGNVELIDSMLYDGLTNVYDNEIMGVIAEETAAKAGATRQAQDELAYHSHRKAAAAERDGNFNHWRVPIAVPNAPEPFNKDETVRAEISAEKLGTLRPAFRKDGTITPGNASTISDGAAMVLVASESGLSRCGNKPLARIVSHATSGGPPRELFFAPIGAIRRVCEKAGWSLRDVDLFEINEAFAAQMLACLKGLEIDAERVNVWGGAIALGHPIGCSGARILGTAAHALKKRSAKKAIISLCLGGGNAVAMAIEAV
ncbi:MAG: acetyl-CoA C-acyltransferase [Phycisphaerales bacterium]|nr:acetyl-CoA C-acyltransferase [Phycisphaerales bacterium]